MLPDSGKMASCDLSPNRFTTRASGGPMGPRRMAQVGFILCVMTFGSIVSALEGSDPAPVASQPVPSGSASNQASNPPPVASQPVPPGSAASPPAVEWPAVSLKLEPIPPLRIDTGTSKAEVKETTPWWSYLAPTIGPIVAGIIALFGVRLGLKMTKQTAAATQAMNEAVLWQKANEAELTNLQTQLNTFYGPLLHLLRTDHLMAQELRARLQETDPQYRMLIRVFDSGWREGLSRGDQKIVEQVCLKAVELEKFIAEKSGLVDEQIQQYLARASVHFRVLHLAYKGELGDSSKNFSIYVYPQSLDHVLRLEVERLRKRCDALRANPGTSPDPMPALVIPDEIVDKKGKKHDLRLPEWPDPERWVPPELQPSEPAPAV